jgi:hypothetical protein
MGERNPESSEALIQYLEQVSGRALRSREDIRRYLDEVARQNAGPSGILQTLKQGTWLVLLVVAYLQYYLLDIMNQVNSMPEIRVNLPITQLHHKPPPRI